MVAHIELTISAKREKAMTRLTWVFLVMGMAAGLWGCATSEPAKVAAPVEEQPTFFYVGDMELSLKSAPDPASSDAGQLSLNDRVQQLKRQGSWFLVRSDDGRQGWANDRDLKLRPVTDLYVRRWGVHLRGEPQEGGKRLGRLRANDPVTLVDKNSQGWAKVTASRLKATGWVQFRDLSLSKVTIRRVRRAKPGEAASTPKETAEPAPAPATGPSLGPKPAEAAPPPAETAPAPRRAKPGMFEPL
jgi:uncharacterized protein YgiM (DUF1202 family)